MAENFVFVMNISSLEKDEFTIAPGHVLRRAKPEEIERIGQFLANATNPGPPAKLHWESEPQPGGSGPNKPLAPENFRYFVMAPEGTSDETPWIRYAADISIRELELGPTISTLHWGWVYNPGRLFQFVSGLAFGEACTPFLESHAVELSSIYSRLKNHDKMIDVVQMASAIGQLKEMDRRSHLVVLGYFAMLESLLTHQPKPSDPNESITRQIKKKVALLDNRWSPRIDYRAFSGAPPDRIWEKMYAYRSILAHGEKPDFERGNLQTLGGSAQALSLVKETVKSIARFALVDPQLLQDLKDC
jgi:hypothetical protein